MGLFENMGDLIDRGATVARGAVSTVGGESLGFVRTFTRMCVDGWTLGYHERNGGNASMRLADGDINAVRPFFNNDYGFWTALPHAVPEMANEYLLVTGTGKHLRNAQSETSNTIGIVRIDASGSAWKLMWGLTGDGQPTSELLTHLEAHAVRKRATAGQARVLYHAHPTSAIALTATRTFDARTLTRLLWQSHTESIVAFPGGVGFVGWMVPGSEALAQATAAQLARFEACVWQLHGVFASSETCDGALGTVQAIDKAASAYLAARAAVGGAEPPYAIPVEGLRATARAYGLQIAEDFLV